MSTIESSYTSEDITSASVSASGNQNRDSLSLSLANESYSETGDSSIIDSSITNVYRNHEKLQNVPPKQGSNNTILPFYRRKRFWSICIAITVVLSAIFIPLLFLVIIPAAAQNAINTSKLDFEAINITNATNDSFLVNMSGKISQAGSFDAKVEFDGPMTIFYNDKELGSAELEDINVTKGEGSVSVNSNAFNIKDKELFNSFASESLKAPSFKWTFRGRANVRTLGMTIKNLKLDNEVIIPGSNGYNTTLTDLKITQNPDNQSFSLNISTNLYNPSPIGIELGDMTLRLSYNGTIMADAIAKGVFIKAKDNNLTMTAVSKIPTTDSDRSNYIKVISGYLTNTPIETDVKVLSVVSPNGKIDWINLAVQSMNLTSAIGKAPKAPEILADVDFGEMNIKFTPDTAFSPTISSKNTSAQIKLPFNISFKVLTVEQNITIFAKGKPVANIVTPESNVTNTQTGISLDIAETQMKVNEDWKDSFKDFLVGLTTTKGYDVEIVGTSNVRTSTILGNNILIEGLPINISTTLQGFDQFNNDGGTPPVNEITVLEGASDHITIGLIASLTNPSKASISIGPIEFKMFFREQEIGSAVIQDLTVAPGTNSLVVVVTLNDPEKTAGKEIITSYLTGQNITVNIRGFDGSTNITSLIPAMKATDIASSLPPSPQSVFSNTKLAFDNQTGSTNGVADIINNFVAPISIYTLSSTFSFNGSTLGFVEPDLSSHPIFIPGNTVLRLTIPISMTPPDPIAALTMIRYLAIQNGLDVTVFDSLIAYSKINVPGVDPNVQPTPQAIASFNLATFITTALKRIPTTIELNSQVAIGYYFLNISTKQVVITETDENILKLIPAYAQPLLNQSMSQVQSTYDSVFIHNIDVASFDVSVIGQVTNTGPLPGEISFPNGMEVSSGGVVLGKLTLPPISIVPPTGAKLNNVSRFDIADVPTFTNFSLSLLATDKVTGELSGNVIFTTYGIPFGPIAITQPISVDGLSNSLQMQFNGATFPTADNPNFSASVSLTNPSTVGIELGKVVFNLFIGSDQISAITGNNIVIVPKGVSNLTFQGPIPLSNPNVVSAFFSKAPVTVQGASVTPPKATGVVVWLNEPFKNIRRDVPLDLSNLGGTKNPVAPPAPQAAPQAAAPPPPVSS